MKSVNNGKIFNGMRSMKRHLLLFAAVLFCAESYSQTLVLSNDFSDTGQKIDKTGRGECVIADGMFAAEGAYSCFGEAGWKDYVLSFRARAPKNTEQVQIWAGFRAYNRFDRYVVGIKGGLQDDLYLMRLGYNGTDEFLGVRPLGFHPVPGEWYRLKVEVCGDRIRVFVNDNEKPHMDVIDKNSRLAPSGKVTLGGGWLKTEFDDLEVSMLPGNALDGVAREEYREYETSDDKEERRITERKSYSPVVVDSLNGSRTEISLDGNWLFMPEYQLTDRELAVSPKEDDDTWHIMNVPDFWNPIRIWLHGEVMPAPNGQEAKGVSDTYYQMETARCEGYTFDYRKTTSAWYRQWVYLPKELKGKHSELIFDAVSKFTDIYINGRPAASHIGMFGEIKVDATDFLRPGKNLVALKVTGKLKNNGTASDNETMDFFYSSVRDSEGEKDISVKKDLLKDVAHGFYIENPAGIWQPVKLVVTEKASIDDAFIRPALDGASFDVTLKNAGQYVSDLSIFTVITDKETGDTLYSGLSADGIQLKSGESSVWTYDIRGLKPRLWSPRNPCLYDFTFILKSSGRDEIDKVMVESGFRTFEIRDGYFCLNGKRYWIRGGNHIPFALAPNDVRLADTFMQLMKYGNIDVTRTHTTPWNRLWIEAADRNGIGVSYEGTWPWLMIHDTPIPDERVLELWRSEFLSLLKKYRNHPSILFWTVNNEMKFYDSDKNIERAKEKYRIISDVVKEMRKIDPTRPICFDSNYHSKGKEEKYGKEFMDSIDDGDIDDMHAYYNWYNAPVFHQFNGEFQKNFKVPDRPLISQEMSTGYPNNETGHPTRSYQLIHQNPYTLVGYEAYDFADPASFLSVQSFITGELAEALRRSNDRASGFMHFALLTWFRQVYDYRNIDPYPTYYALKRAMQPVLVSAELWGRHFYAGEKIPARIYVANDREDGSDLSETILRWELQDEKGMKLTGGKVCIPPVGHYERKYIEPDMLVPENLPEDKVNARLLLRLTENGLTVSENEYSLLLASKDWTGSREAGRPVLLENGAETEQVLESLGIGSLTVRTVEEMADSSEGNVCIVSGMKDISGDGIAVLRSFIAEGGKVLFLNSAEIAAKVFPEIIKDVVTPKDGDIVCMERDDHPVFEGIGVLDLRYFNNNRREIPDACNAVLKTERDSDMVELAGHMDIHAYINGKEMSERIAEIESLRGLTMIQINEGKGKCIVSTMCTEKGGTDPVAGRLLVNMMKILQ